MTGTFVRAHRASVCVSMNCHTAIVVGSWVYLFLGQERQTVCTACALRRWGYAQPADSPSLLPAKPSRIHVEGARTVESNFTTFNKGAAGAELRRNILSRRELEQANANDPKLKQAGGEP